MRAQWIILHALAVVALSAVCLAQGLPPSPGQTNQPGMGQPGQQGGVNRNGPRSITHDMDVQGDNIFVADAAEGGMAEVSLGNLAKQNGGSDAVKQFGDRMVTDHSKANDELRHLAEQKGIAVPSGVSRKDKKKAKALEARRGSDFDKAYIHDMVKDHEADVAEFRNEAAYGEDPDVKAWAQKTLPVLEQHLAAAKQLAEQVGADTNKKSAQAMSSHQ